MPGQIALHRHEDPALQAIRGNNGDCRHAECRRHAASRLLRAAAQRAYAAALGAVAMDDVDLQSAGKLAAGAGGRDVEMAEAARHLGAVEAQCEEWFQFPEARFRQGVRGKAVTENANAVAASGLLTGQVPDVTEQATDRGSQDMENAHDNSRGKSVAGRGGAGARNGRTS